MGRCLEDANRSLDCTIFNSHFPGVFNILFLRSEANLFLINDGQMNVYFIFLPGLNNWSKQKIFHQSRHWWHAIILFQACNFRAETELLRAPQIVRVGLIQNSIALQTTAPFLDQKRAIFEKLKPIIDSAGASGVNVLCLQVGHSLFKMYFLSSPLYWSLIW